MRQDVLASLLASERVLAAASAPRRVRAYWIAMTASPPQTPAPAQPATEDPMPAPPAEPAGPAHDEWLLDEALAETFPASDPIAPARGPGRSGP